MKLQLVDSQRRYRCSKEEVSFRIWRGATSILPLILTLLAFALAGPAWADHDDQRANPEVYGKTIGNWGHAWWQWVSNFDAGEDPIQQNGDVDCSAGQRGKV